LSSALFYGLHAGPEPVLDSETVQSALRGSYSTFRGTCVSFYSDDAIDGG
jgi:hypothetical protein